MVGLPYDFLANPLGAVRLSFERAVGLSPPDADMAAAFRGKDWGAVDQFREFLFEKGGLAQVPILDASTIGSVQPNTLVRFRGMVQDMLGNELYVGAFKDGSTWRTNKFTDVASFPMPPSCETQLWERHLLYCVPVPGQNAWTVQPSQSPSAIDASISTSQNVGKRQRNTEDDLDLNVLDNEDQGYSPNSKKQKENEHSCQSSSLPDDLVNSGSVSDIPNGDLSNLSCLVKIYDIPESQLKLNDDFEFIGIYTFDPELAVLKDDSDDPMLELFDDPVAHLPPSKVPRLHCLISHKLTIQHFLSDYPPTIEPLPSIVRGIRESLLAHLTAVLGNDRVAAEYLLLHLLSRVRAQVDMMTVGKLALNLTSFTRESASVFGPQLIEAIQKLLPYTRAISLTLDYLNKSTLQPRKKETGRLATGVLQLAQGTHLTIDETCMGSGTLTSNGVENTRLLVHLFEWQKVEYDFDYYKLEMAADVQLLVLSEAKSNILPADLVLPFCPKSIVSVRPTKEDLQAWRWYLATMRFLPHSTTPEMSKILQDEMVAAMREDRSLGCREISRWLTMQELMAASLGEKSLTLEHCRMIKELERLRKERLKGSFIC